MINSKPRLNQSRGSVHRVNQDIENMLTCWMVDNETNKRIEGFTIYKIREEWPSLHCN